MRKKDLKNKKNINITGRDAEILLFLLETRFLTREQIERLFFANGQLNSTTTAKTNRRLFKLLNHGFLERIVKPVSVGRPKSVYGLGRKGYQVLSKVLERDSRSLTFKKKNNKVEFFFLEHSLAIAELRVSLEVAFRKRPDLELLFWIRESKELNDRVKDPTKKQKYLPVRPDAFFGIQTNLGKSYFFLEVDMATQEHKRFQRKIIAYKEYWKKEIYQEKYGFNSFRVLTVTTGERRLANLLKTAQRAGAKNMFLFALQKEIREGKVFDPIWCKPGSRASLHYPEDTQENRITIV